MDPELLQRITARRAEPDELEEQLIKQLAEVRAERAELAVAGRVLERVSGQLADGRASVAPTPGQVGGRAVMLIPHRAPAGEDPPPRGPPRAFSPLCGRPPGRTRPGGLRDAGRRRHRAGQAGTTAREAGQTDRGRLRKLPDGRFTTRL
ncbi:hypothetical protein [Streptomyces sp. NEAU-W12]|uniref:hypothetical protein n=1 Tax=Streptomyces sp. NEAU-W12 TaxID=2994668 RepID=UPI00224B8369|nr:hypothetical protein [Streptomyces sp. NEAU-W12]MCX2924728.1 hypothetical protein [Streptomyces sp. NEAU-W12]